jgi:polyhydroxyalkanoate synthase
MAALATSMGRAADYGGSRPTCCSSVAHQPADVLDLSAEKVAAALAARASRAAARLGWDVEARRDLSWRPCRADPSLHRRWEPPALVGYCLGGTMALARRCACEGKAVALIARPGTLPASERRGNARFGAALEPAVRRWAFCRWRYCKAPSEPRCPNGPRKFEAIGRCRPAAPKGQPSVASRIGRMNRATDHSAAAREMIVVLSSHDLRIRWVQWTALRPSLDRLLCPILNNRSPPPTASFLPRHCNGRGRADELDQGHVGISSACRSRSRFGEPLEAWLSRVAAC